MNDRRFKAAVAVMQGLSRYYMGLDGFEDKPNDYVGCADACIKFADALIAELERTDPGKPVTGTDFVDSVQPKVKQREPREWMLYFAGGNWRLADGPADNGGSQFQGAPLPFHWVRVREVIE